jgi:hypothetical protein
MKWAARFIKEEGRARFKIREWAWFEEFFLKRVRR